jgi:hypothetical protein
MSKNYSNQAGKGDTYRPVDKKKYDENFDGIIWKIEKENNEKIKKSGKITFLYK